MDIQVVLVVILSLLTINLIAVGIYVIMVLKEFRDTIKKFNSVLDTLKEVTDTVSAPLSSFSTFFSGLTSGFKFLSSIKSLRKDDEE